MSTLKTHVIYIGIIVILGGTLGGISISLCSKSKALKQSRSDVASAKDRNDKLVEECDHQMQAGVDECRNVLTSMKGDCDIIAAADKRIEELYSGEKDTTPNIKKLGLHEFINELNKLIKEGRDEMGGDNSTDPNVASDPL